MLGGSVRLRWWVVMCIGWAIVMAPWLAKNVVDTRNPVYPLASDGVFPSPDWDDGRESQWQAVHGPKPIEFRESLSSIGRRGGTARNWSPIRFGRCGSSGLDC